MFQVDENIKLGDFGLSVTVNGNIHALSSFGTPLYRSPELFKRMPYNSASDIWYYIFEYLGLRVPNYQLIM
jgi:serine/threonine protein kinase